MFSCVQRAVARASIKKRCAKFGSLLSRIGGCVVTFLRLGGAVAAAAVGPAAAIAGDGAGFTGCAPPRRTSVASLGVFGRGGAGTSAAVARTVCGGVLARGGVGGGCEGRVKRSSAWSRSSSAGGNGAGCADAFWPGVSVPLPPEDFGSATESKL